MSLLYDLAKRGIVLGNSDEVLITAKFFKSQRGPTAMTTAGLISTDAILKGIITGLHDEGGNENYAVPEGENLDHAITSLLLKDFAFDFTIINLSAALADTITLIPNTGITLVGSGLINSAHVDSNFPSSGTFRCRKTDANTFVVYRLR